MRWAYPNGGGAEVIRDSTKPTQAADLVIEAAEDETDPQKSTVTVTWGESTDAFGVDSYSVVLYKVTTDSDGNVTKSDTIKTITVEADKELTASYAVSEYGQYQYSVTAMSCSQITGDTAYSDVITAGVSQKTVVSKADGDLDGNSLADVIMTIDNTSHPADGATGAWLIKGDQTPVWGNLSQRNPGWCIFGTGWTSADKKTTDVYIKNEDNVIGAWVTDNSGAVSSWTTVGEFDANTEILGLGDFNGDGQTDLLLRNTNGAIGSYLTSGSKIGWNYYQSLGDEWKICGIGDLNGDGRDDVVLKHDAGFAGSWLTQSDGTVVWADLDTLAEGFEIVGCGDFNADGVDDVLLKNGDYCGAWIVKDGSVSSWMGLGTVTGTVEQIADFNADGMDDLRIRTSEGAIGSLLVRGEDKLDWKYYGSVGDEWNTSLASL